MPIGLYIDIQSTLHFTSIDPSLKHYLKQQLKIELRKMVSKAFILLGLSMAIVLLITSQVAAIDVADETTTSKTNCEFCLALQSNSIPTFSNNFVLWLNFLHNVNIYIYMI